VARDVRELDAVNLRQLIQLKYHSLEDAIRELGPARSIREVFVGFQRHLY
jgi:type I restriction enzyme R subunit